MTEEFLHFLWYTRRYLLNDLYTTDGQPVIIQKYGMHNTNAGPDFLDARVIIDGTLWAGNIEFHILSSDWYRHKHNSDPAYDNVILHIVLEENEKVYRNNIVPIPCVEIKRRIPKGIQLQYIGLLQKVKWIPCENFYQKTPELIKNLWLDKVLVERLEEKTELLKSTLEITKNDWEESFYIFLARQFGAKINQEPFEQLARITPLHILQKHQENLFQLEALLFGQSGILNESTEGDYAGRLFKEYSFLKNKYGLEPMNPAGWKFFRLRPTGFPTIRIAQLAAFINQDSRPFSTIVEKRDVFFYEKYLKNSVSTYWQEHYHFGKEGKQLPKAMGGDTIRGLLINGVIPSLFLYAKWKGLDDLQESAIKMLEVLPAEKNKIINNWKKFNQEAQNAFESQALIHLKTRYCEHQKCLKCDIGASILR